MTIKRKKERKKENMTLFFLSNTKGKEQAYSTGNLVCFILAISSESFEREYFSRKLRLLKLSQLCYFMPSLTKQQMENLKGLNALLCLNINIS